MKRPVSSQKGKGRIRLETVVRIIIPNSAHLYIRDISTRLFLCRYGIFDIICLVTRPYTVTGIQTSLTTAGPNTAGSQLIQKVERILSLSNIVGMSMVEGVKISGLLLGDTDFAIAIWSNSGVTGVTPI